MLNKSLQSLADTIIFDLEDSVAPDQKGAARAQLVEFLKVRYKAVRIPAPHYRSGVNLQTNRQMSPSRYSIRINALDTEFFAEDMQHVVSSCLYIEAVDNQCCLIQVSETPVETLVLPKVHQPRDLSRIASHVLQGRKLNVIASIESARSLWNIGGIASWNEKDALKVVGLLVSTNNSSGDAAFLTNRSVRSRRLYVCVQISDAHISLIRY
jgi:citrate lyase subunit beta-like protein